MIVVAILFFFAAGVGVKMVYSPGSGIGSGPTIFPSSPGNNADLESQVRLVAANFRCACGQCGELFLIDCTCDMPRGAVEEKNFIRKKLRQGMGIEEVITATEAQYGHRII